MVEVPPKVSKLGGVSFLKDRSRMGFLPMDLLIKVCLLDVGV